LIVSFFVSFFLNLLPLITGKVLSRFGAKLYLGKKIDGNEGVAGFFKSTTLGRRLKWHF